MVFKPKAYERMRLIQAQAGLRGFFTIFVFNLALMAARLLFYTDSFPEVFDGVLLLSTMAGAVVFTISLSRAGFYKTVRDETTRSLPSQRRSRIRLVVASVLFGAMMFISGEYLETNTENLWIDISASALTAIGWGTFMWYWTARKMKSAEED